MFIWVGLLLDIKHFICLQPMIIHIIILLAVEIVMKKHGSLHGLREREPAANQPKDPSADVMDFAPMSTSHQDDS